MAVSRSLTAEQQKALDLRPQIEAKLRAGTEVLRTGGGLVLTASDCGVMLDLLAALLARTEELTGALEQIAEAAYGRRCYHQENRYCSDDAYRVARSALAGSSPACENGDNDDRVPERD